LVSSVNRVKLVMVAGFMNIDAGDEEPGAAAPA